MAFYLLALLLSLISTAVSATSIPLPGTAGCGKIHTGLGTVKHFALSSGGVLRDVAVYLPKSYFSSVTTQLIVSFHGNGKDMDYQATLSRFTDPHINNNSIAVFPNGLLAGDPPKRCWEGAPYCTTGISDQAFVMDLVEFMRENYCIDNNRIYATGKSIGGGFVDLLACSPDHGETFAAFAMDAAALYTEADGSDCIPAHSHTAILEIHGTDDPTANYNGDTSHGAELPNVRSVLSTWATRNGCGHSPVPTVDEFRSNKVYYTQYDCEWRKSTVIGYNVTGQGHNWISTEPNDDNKGDTASIDASAIMMAFFKANPKPWCWPPLKRWSDRRKCQKHHGKSRVPKPPGL